MANANTHSGLFDAFRSALSLSQLRNYNISFKSMSF